MREYELALDAGVAMQKAGPLRLCPILMTTIATMMSAVPPILGLGPGTETRSPMAVAVLGGLVVSTVLSLLVVPAFYLVSDRAKARLAQRRGGALERVTLDSEHIAHDDQPEALLDLNEAVDRLAAAEPRLARVVECRFFGGLSVEESAEVLKVSTGTVRRDWSIAKFWLYRELGGGTGDGFGTMEATR